MKQHKATSTKGFLLDLHLLATFVAFKLIVVLVTVFFFYYFDASHETNLWNRLYTGENDLNSIYLPFSNWDGQHYLILADKGYGFSQSSQAFFPLFPLSIKVMNFLVRNFYASALLVNLLFSYLFFIFYYKYSQQFCTRDDSLKNVIFIMAYPSAFYLTVFYSEALFLFLLFAFLYYYHKKSNWTLPFLALMPLARGQAVFVLFALAGSVVIRCAMKKPVNYAYEFLNMSSISVGIILYFIFMALSTGSPLAGLKAQEMYVFENSLWNCINLLRFTGFLVAKTNGLFSYNHGLLDKAFIILLLSSIPIVMRSRDPIIICMFIALAYFPASMGNGGSYIRHSLLAIPFLSIVIFSVFSNQKVVMLSIAAVLFVLQIALLCRFSINAWVA